MNFVVAACYRKMSLCGGFFGGSEKLIFRNKGEFVMKKLLALLLVLGMASMVQAGFILSVGGLPAPDVIEIEPSQHITLDIHIEPGTEFNGGDFAIRLSNNQAVLNGADVVFPLSTMRTFNMGLWMLEDNAPTGITYSTVKDTANEYMLSGGSLTWNSTNNATTEGPWFGGYIPAVEANSYPVLMDGLDLHCVEATDVVVELIAPYGISRLLHNASGVVTGSEKIIQDGTVMDSIVIHQIPEPMTMSLLGLGGLALLRRRRA